MKIFLIVMVMMGGQGLNEDLYIIQEPNFNSVNQCIGYVQRNDPYLVAKAQTVYPGRDVENIYCVNKDKLQNLMIGV
jgi:uncharacterized protein (UPF0297 family)